MAQATTQKANLTYSRAILNFRFSLLVFLVTVLFVAYIFIFAWQIGLQQQGKQTEKVIYGMAWGAVAFDIVLILSALGYLYVSISNFIQIFRENTVGIKICSILQFLLAGLYIAVLIVQILISFKVIGEFSQNMQLICGILILFAPLAILIISCLTRALAHSKVSATKAA